MNFLFLINIKYFMISTFPIFSKFNTYSIHSARINTIYGTNDMAFNSYFRQY